MQNNPKFNFPKSFLWGAATSAHQVEGGNHNQWTVWEQESARSLATQAAHKFDDLPGWSRNKRLASTPANYVSARAVDHYRRYKEDFDLLEKMNMNSFRFSVEWSRVEPEEGVWNAAELAHYKSYVTELRKRGIEPILTLFHFTLPVWFAKKGGFLKRKNVDYFVRFAEKVMSELGSSVRFVITINEPTVYAGESFKQGVWPPNLQSTRLLLKVLRNLAYAHKKATKTIKSVQSRAKAVLLYTSPSPRDS